MEKKVMFAGWLIEIETQSQYGNGIIGCPALQVFRQRIWRKIKNWSSSRCNHNDYSGLWL
jgi:hypothetical protein